MTLVFRHAQLLKVGKRHLALNQAQGYGFAMDRGNGGNSEIPIGIVNAKIQVAVLGYKALLDFHSCEPLDAGGNTPCHVRIEC